MKRLAILWCMACFSLLDTKAACLPSDSIGTEKKGGKNYILHKVDPKETLFSISRKYGVAVDLIRKANPDAASGLNIGQILLVPISDKIAGPSLGNENKTHKVLPKETLFSISQKYKVSVEALKRANGGMKEGLKTGQIINIPGTGDKTTVTEKTSTAKASPDKEQNVQESKEVSQKIADTKVSAEPVKSSKEPDRKAEKSVAISAVPPPASSSYKKVSETGFAELMENNQDGLKYLALHKNAPAGTIIQVRNDENNQKIFVRVVGNLKSSSEKTVLQISPKAFERLGGKSSKIPVSISYIP